MMTKKEEIFINLLLKEVKKDFRELLAIPLTTLLKKIKPNSYDILACLTKYDPESFENFCSEYGYDNDKISHKKIYNAVAKEFINVCKIWNDEEIEKLREIN